MKKQLNKFLILAVIVLWGTILYRYFGHYFMKDEGRAAEMKSTNDRVNIDIKRDTFHLEKLVRDPFLSKYRSVAKKSNFASNRKAKKHANPVNSIPEPVNPDIAIPRDIAYFGTIKPGDCDELAVIKIDGKLLRLKKGEIKGDIKINRFDNKSVTIKIGKKDYLINKN